MKDRGSATRKGICKGAAGGAVQGPCEVHERSCEVANSRILLAWSAWTTQECCPTNANQPLGHGIDATRSAILYVGASACFPNFQARAATPVAPAAVTRCLF